MSLRTLGVLQWFGLLGAALTWTGQHAVGFGVTQARCLAGSSHWAIGNDVWQLALTAAGGLVVAGAEAAAVAVFLATRDVEESAAPPQGRLHFFAVAAMAANVIFLGIVLLDGFGAILTDLCRQS